MIFSRLIVCLLFGFVLPASAAVSSGRVVAVLDGDTIIVLTSDRKEMRVRFAGIDAPEKAQPYGARSKQSLSDAVYGKTVSVDVVAVDFYGRSIGVVSQGGVDINLMQVEKGMAWHYAAYKKNQTEQQVMLYSQAQKKAMAGHIGLWADANPVPPWSFRREK